MRRKLFWIIPLLAAAPVAAALSQGDDVGARFPVRMKSSTNWPGREDGARSFNGNGQVAAVVLNEGTHDVQIGPALVTGFYRGIEMAKMSGIYNVTIDGFTGEVARECIRLRASSVRIQRTHCVQAGGPTSKRKDLPEGVHAESGTNVVIEKSSFSGFQSIGPDKVYWNGDGIAAERAVAGLTIRDVVANDNTDAGFDIKPAVTMDRVSAARNCRNFRFWSDAKIGTMTVGDTKKRGGISGCAGIWLKGAADTPPQRIEINVLRIASKAPLTVFAAEGYAEIRVKRCLIDVDPSVALKSFSSDRRTSITGGRGCERIILSEPPRGASTPAHRG